MQDTMDNLSLHPRPPASRSVIDRRPPAAAALHATRKETYTWSIARIAYHDNIPTIYDLP